jgi:hypothetical protein
MTNPAAAASVASVLAERMVERLHVYRRAVARVAGGEGLPAVEADELPKVMYALGLPSFAFQRDVRAWAGWPTTRGYRRAELALNHPQLFDDAEVWVAERTRTIARQRVAAR